MTTLGDSAGRREIVDRIAHLSANDQAIWGTMSVHQMMCHLADAYRVPLRERIASPASGFLQRTVLKWAALWVPLKWMKGFPTRPEIEQGRGGSLTVNFDSDKEALICLLRRFCDELREPCEAHPIFGEMKIREWWRWGYLHADHHLRQFRR